jgi:LacI family transcriptional regulator
MTVQVVRLLGPDFGRVALVGFDELPLADLLSPAVTVVAQADGEMGREAVRMLHARMAEPGRRVGTKTLPTTLIARGSGEQPPSPSGNGQRLHLAPDAARA